MSGAIDLNDLPPTVRAAIDTVRYSSTGRESAGARALAGSICNGVVCYLNPASEHTGNEALAAEIRRDAEALLAQQNADGTIDGGNIRTPPDTGFVMEALGAALTAVRNAYGDEIPSAELRAAVELGDRFMKRGAAALVTGGIHTPNHRWVVCSALAFAHYLYGESSYRERIDEWLAEGIDLDEDGQYCEHSAGIYSAVSSRALLNVALLLGRDELLEPVRRNLETTLLLAQPDGRIETVASRRQDQYDTTNRWSHYYVPLRVLAAIDGNARFAAAVASLEAMAASETAGDADAVSPLAHYAITFFSFSEMTVKFPPADIASLPNEFSVLLGRSGLYRERHGQCALSIFGGHDRWPDGEVTPEVSGRAGNPTWLTFCAGAASIRWVRILPRFFTIGYLRPRLVSQDGSITHLEISREIGYFQPLAAEERRPDGRYELSTGDGRFWSAIDLDKRELTNVQSVGVSIAVHPRGDGCDVDITADASTPLAFCVEIAADPNSTVTGGDWDAGVHGTTIQNGASAIRVELQSDRPVPWVPTDRDYGDMERMRRLAEREIHAGAQLQIVHASFEAPGSARLSIRGEGEG